MEIFFVTCACIEKLSNLNRWAAGGGRRKRNDCADTFPSQVRPVHSPVRYNSQFTSATFVEGGQTELNRRGTAAAAAAAAASSLAFASAGRTLPLGDLLPVYIRRIRSTVPYIYLTRNLILVVQKAQKGLQ